MIRRRSAPLRIRKRSFLLFELLISLALISLCLFPLLKPHAAMRKEDRVYLEEMQFENHDRNAFCAVKQRLFENEEHSWSQLRNSIEGELDEIYTIFLNSREKREYRCRYKLSKLDFSHKPSNNKDALVIAINLTFYSAHSKDQSFIHTLYLEQQI